MNKLTPHGRTLLLGAFSLFLGIINVFLFYEQGIGLNYPLFILLVVASGLFLAQVFSRRLEREHYAVIFLAVFFASMVFVRSSEMLTFFNVLGSMLLLLVAIRMLTGKYMRSFLASDYVKVVFLPFRFIRPFFETFPAIVCLKKVSGENARTKEIIRGSLMAVVALITFAWLFSSADRGFNTLLSGIFTFNIDQEVIQQFFLGAFVTAFFVGAFSFMLRKLHSEQVPAFSVNARNLGAIEIMILLGSINVLFFVFIVLQISYLFGGAPQFLAEGLTYAEYAREGFFQLVVVAMLSFVIISFAEKQIIQNDGRHLHSFKIFCSVLVLHVIAILVSAFSRLSLYEDAYGFTEIRLYSHALMIWLGALFLLLSLHIWKNEKPTDFSFRAFCTIVIFLLSMNLLNPDAFVAKKNLERYHLSGELDANYLATLSHDALPYTIHLLDDEREEISKSFARGLYWREGYCTPPDCADRKHSSSWQSMRFNQTKMEELLAPRRGMLEENKSWSKDSLVD